jgi:hypothetical protein
MFVNFNELVVILYEIFMLFDRPLIFLLAMDSNIFICR